ncbi:MAG: H-NS histone family protein [Magnetococcales bacterium]|nr:H-NS histone family protein [Magnetococcales bacterium]
MSKGREDAQQGATQAVQSVIGELSLEELVSLKTNLEFLIAQKQKEAKKVLHGQMLAMAQSAGFESVEAFLAGQTGRRSRSDKGTSRLPKYRDPADASRTWTGKGRKPFWVIAHLDAGGQLEELGIR